MVTWYNCINWKNANNIDNIKIECKSKHYCLEDLISCASSCIYTLIFLILYTDISSFKIYWLRLAIFSQSCKLLTLHTWIFISCLFLIHVREFKISRACPFLFIACSRFMDITFNCNSNKVADCSFFRMYCKPILH